MLKIKCPVKKSKSFRGGGNWPSGGPLCLEEGNRSAAPHLRTIGQAYVHEVRSAGPLVQICTTAERLQSGGFGTLVPAPVNGYQRRDFRAFHACQISLLDQKSAQPTARYITLTTKGGTAELRNRRPPSIIQMTNPHIPQEYIPPRHIPAGRAKIRAIFFRAARSITRKAFSVPSPR